MADARSCPICGGPMALVGPGKLEQCGVGLSVPADIWRCESGKCGETVEWVPRREPPKEATP